MQDAESGITLPYEARTVGDAIPAWYRGGNRRVTLIAHAYEAYRMRWLPHEPGYKRSNGDWRDRAYAPEYDVRSAAGRSEMISQIPQPRPLWEVEMDPG